MKVSEIQNATLGVVRIPGAKKPWRVTIQDPDSKEVIWIDLTQQVADQIVAKLTGGIIVPRVQ